MAQLRQDYDQLQAQDVEVLMVGPDKPEAFRSRWADKGLPYVGLPDPKHTVLKLYGQEIKIFKFGRMPAQVLIDKEGIAKFVHYGHDMTDIPSAKSILESMES